MRTYFEVLGEKIFKLSPLFVRPRICQKTIQDRSTFLWEKTEILWVSGVRKPNLIFVLDYYLFLSCYWFWNPFLSLLQVSKPRGWCYLGVSDYISVFWFKFWRIFASFWYFLYLSLAEFSSKKDVFFFELYQISVYFNFEYEIQ